MTKPIAELTRDEFRACLEPEVERRLASGASLEEMVIYLHDQQLSIIESMLVLRTVTKQDLASIKRLVTSQPVWESLVRATEPLHDALIEALEADAILSNGSESGPRPTIEGLHLPARQP